jgi:hypothetical protein
MALTDEQRLEAVREIYELCETGPKPRLIYVALQAFEKAARERIVEKKEQSK